MPSYFASIGHPCPSYSNPCDFYVDLTTVSFRSAESEAETSSTVNAVVAAFSRAHDVLRLDAENDDIATTAGSSGSGKGESGSGFADVATLWHQFKLLTVRAFHHQLKDRDRLLLDLIQSVTVALVIGVVFWVRGNAPIPSTSSRKRTIKNTWSC